MKKLHIIIAAAFFAALTGAYADTSYLLIQGPFGLGGTGETFKWQVNYPTGYLLSGLDLLSALFGSPSLDGTYTDGFGGTYNHYAAGTTTQGAGYIDFGTNPNQLTAPFMISVTLASTTVLQDPSYSPGWNYYVAGGGSNNRSGYANNGAWTYSNDGEMARTLADGSFDGWVFGSTFPPATIQVQGGANTPTLQDFVGATVLNVPEPGSVALLLIGAGGMLVLGKRRCAERRLHS